MKLRIIFFCAIITFVNLLYAQRSLSLNECLAYGFENNLNISKYINNKAKSRVLLNQSRFESLPTLNAEYNHYLSSGRSLNIETYSWDNEDIRQGNLTVTAELVIFQGLYNLWNRREGLLNIDISTLEIEQEKLLLGLEIIDAYYSLKSAKENLNIIELAHFNTLQEIQKLEQQIMAGTMPASNLYELQAQEKKEYIETIVLTRTCEKEYNNLVRLLNWKEDYALQLNNDTENLSKSDSVFYSRNEYQIENLLNNSILTIIANKKIELADNNIQIQKSQLLPVISASSSISSRYLKDAIDPASTNESYNYLDQLNNNQYKQVGLTISIPIFNKHQIRSEIKLSELELRNMEIEKKQALLQLHSELQSIRKDIIALNNRISESNQMSDIYEKSFEVAKEKYHSGLLDSYTLNISKNNYTNSILENNMLKTELRLNYELISLYSKFISNSAKTH